MRKTDKKIDNQLRLVLTDVCEIALKDIDGFRWLTHLINYTNFPKSLRVICVFNTEDNLKSFIQSSKNKELNSLIQSRLQDVNIKFKNIGEHISYDTDEACKKEHDGNWAVRLG